ncbi:probable LRR receptor-like serine/threonine-protein kinase At1g07650 isoform X1 [Juglans microcarpa x Juglans regia]|uniref:probable LRR receptor-like serine/threonine-protein kinase At1g07650 isoform X1 n=1 Tax=Juglans microcarpa x Juglans regia TaxID=2249226 RepID=UPI001B7E0EF8|nr:probable LRR receptor-like serine/threonine-protein kinase At1g07650 isoform X1 [Juglans microcarpa x Juglans regia]
MAAVFAIPKLLLALVVFYTTMLSFATFGLAATAKLHSDEVEVLKKIGEKLGKKDWDFGIDPCSGEGNWQRLGERKGFESNVTCDCTFNGNSSCHVVKIDICRALKAQNLSSTLPPEFSKLHYLKQLDLSRNYLTGSIPPQWATMHLVELSLMGNSLSGPFPTVLTWITTLKNLSIEVNRFSGPIPPEIGKLINLQKLILSSNAFTGELPIELAKLTNLTDMRVSDNNFSGKIPDFIGNWTQIKKLHMGGCFLEGPIPSSISALRSLSDLRITDLKGQRSTFPPLSNMESMKTMILRKCQIYGEIPGYIGYMEKLKILDLSFNGLTGEIPLSFVQLDDVDLIYLTGNRLTGSIPGWLLGRNKNADVSYNNFTWESSSPVECPRGSVNLVESYSAEDKLSRIHPCLKRNFPCPAVNNERHYLLHINCGGKEASVNGTKYEADREQRGASMFYLGQNWAFSSTGNFMDNDVDADIYIGTNTSALSNVSVPDSELYTTARASPLSLTYYGLCLMNGNYTVKLHFAEIIFTNDRSFNSLGKRIFNVYMQDKLVLENFNIEDEAGGAGKPLIKSFTAVVTSGTLKIHFYWAGKGTTGIPDRGEYGPLISAISVDPNFEPPSDGDNKDHLIIVVVAAVVLLGLLALFVMWRKGWMGDNGSANKELRGIDLQTGLFTLRQIRAATENFNPANKLGEGGFGSVYKGVLSDGTVIAVKQLSSKSKQGNREFVNEIGLISALQHPNLVKLYGCCIEGNQLLLIYEYMENNCLSRALFGKDTIRRLKLDWPTRQKICIGIARGLAYLHEESRLKIVHRDIKTSNVLLDEDYNAKISDFGLAKLTEDDKTHISTRVAGTIGYMAPEYAMRGYLTNKADVYSFGVVALEIVSGKSNTNYRPKEEFVYLLDWAYVLQERGSLLELVDPELGLEYSSEEAIVMLNVALLCTNASPTLRPTMSQVVSMLEGATTVEDLRSDPAVNSKYKIVRDNFWQNPSSTHSMSIDGLCTNSSCSYIELGETGDLLRASSIKSDE